MVDGVSGRGGRRRHGLNCLRTAEGTINRQVEAKTSTPRWQRGVATGSERQTKDGDLMKDESERVELFEVKESL